MAGGGRHHEAMSGLIDPSIARLQHACGNSMTKVCHTIAVRMLYPCCRRMVYTQVSAGLQIALGRDRAITWTPVSTNPD